MTLNMIMLREKTQDAPLPKVHFYEILKKYDLIQSDRKKDGGYWWEWGGHLIHFSFMESTELNMKGKIIKF